MLSPPQPLAERHQLARLRQRRADAGRLAATPRGQEPDQRVVAYLRKGIGTALLNDAIRRAIQAADIAGITALLVHAISGQARRFDLSRGFV